jgi:hypothetical protein
MNQNFLFTGLNMNFEQEFQDAVNRNTDIHEHLELISSLVSECSHGTELGVGWAQSTRAFLRHNIRLHSYEFQPLPGVVDYFVAARQAGRDVSLHVADTRNVTIEPTDIMLVDSLHIYEQVQKELQLHADKVRKYILFHDTTTFAVNGEFGGKGIWPAVQEFMDTHPEWQMIERRTNNNGLTVLKRVS